MKILLLHRTSFENEGAFELNDEQIAINKAIVLLPIKT